MAVRSNLTLFETDGTASTTRKGVEQMIPKTIQDVESSTDTDGAEFVESDKEMAID